MSIMKTAPSRKRPFGVVAGAGAILAAGVLWAAGVGESAAVSSTAELAPKGLSVLRGPAVTLGDLPDQQRRAIEALGRTLSVELSTVHRAAPGVWVAASGGKTCIFSENTEGIGGSCAPNADAEAGKLGLQVRSMDGDASENIGLAPDGITSVTGRSASGERVAADVVENNVFRVRGEALESLSFVGVGSRQLKVAD